MMALLPIRAQASLAGHHHGLQEMNPGLFIRNHIAGQATLETQAIQLVRAHHPAIVVIQDQEAEVAEAHGQPETNTIKIINEI